MSSIAMGTAGQIAGGALGGVLGGMVGGPVRAWIGRAIGSRVGGMAGRAAAEALSSYMEDADAAAEAETKDHAAAKPCVDCGEIDCFEPPDGPSKDEIEEFEKQLEEQRDAINDIPPDQLVKKMETYENIGRGAKDAADRKMARDAWANNRASEVVNKKPGTTRDAARAAARSEIKTMDVIHTPDLSAGGTGRVSPNNGGLGPRSANRSIGSQWSKGGNNTDGKTRLEQLKEHAQKAKEKGERTNVDLRLCKEGESSKSGKKSSGRGTGGTGSSKGDGSNIPMS